MAAAPRRLVRKGSGDGDGERLTRVMGKDLNPVALSRSIVLSKKGGTGKNRCRQSVVHRETEEDEFHREIWGWKIRLPGCCFEDQLDGTRNDLNSSELTT